MTTNRPRIYSAVRAFAPEAAQWLSQLRFRMAAAMPFKPNPNSNVVVSLTTFPARAHLAWIPIECIFQQEFKPARVVLVLSEGEFPDRALPAKLEHQQRRGLEIIWTSGNMGSYKKLLPTMRAYPDFYIVTFDDDCWVQSWRLGQLVDAAVHNPRTVVGHRGREIQLGEKRQRLAPYFDWPHADTATPPERTFLTGAGGIIYPPHCLPHDALCDYELAAKLAPNADDVWFWAMAKLAGLSIYCLGTNDLDPIEALMDTPKLEMLNRHKGRNDDHLAAVIDHFGLWDELTKPPQHPGSVSTSR